MGSTVETIKERLGIVDVVNTYLRLEKAGSNLKAKCPFHNEKTPSFFVSPTRNTYYCFGCGSKGDIFTFIQEFEGLDFKGALKVLAERAGVPIEYEHRDKRDERERLFGILEEATLFFEKQFRDNERVKRYLAERGVENKTFDVWRIGYAPDGWRHLYAFLKERGFSDVETEKSGLIKRSEKGFYDRFRNRIMFPISDSSGRVVAFSGRVFEETVVSGVTAQPMEAVAKYINSPETPLFNKSTILYGYDKAKMAIRKWNFSVIVEGQMDIILSHQSGLSNTVALSGTALSERHVEALKRLSNNVVLAFDSDSAGFAAAGRNAEVALAEGLDVKVAALPKGNDPADLIKKDPNKWKHAVKEAKHIVEFTLDVIAKQGYDERKFRLEAARLALPYVARIQNAIDQAHFVSLTAKRMNISEEAVWRELKRVHNTLLTSKIHGPARLSQQSNQSSQNMHAGFYGKDLVESPYGRRKFIERSIRAIISWQKTFKEPVIDVEKTHKRLQEICGDDDVSSVADEASSPTSDELLFEAEVSYSESNRLERDLEELFLNLEEEVLKERYAQVMDALREAERRGDNGGVERALVHCNELSKKIAKLAERRAR
jgi:DNA primase